MAKINKPGKHVEARTAETDEKPKLLVDEAGEPVISDDDPDIIPMPEEELEITPPYEAPPPGEGP